MKKIVAALCISTCLWACNNNSESESTTSDTGHADHSSATGTQSDTASNYMKAMHDAMDNSMQQMHNMKPTGDADYDFAMMMKHHHQGANDMAKAQVAGGSNEQLKQLAQKMIDEQQKENVQFDQFMQGKQPTGNSDYGQKAIGMMTPMSEIKMEGGSLDAMFASMMIPHHQDAVKMAQEYIKVGKDAEMKKIAQSIIATQPKEIQELQQWLQTNK